MNQTSWLEQTLDRARKRLLQARQILEKNPNSYSAKVTSQSAEQRLSELENRLKAEQENLSSPPKKKKKSKKKQKKRHDDGRLKSIDLLGRTE